MKTKCRKLLFHYLFFMSGIVNYICLFVCFCGLYRPTSEFVIHLETSCRRKAANLDLSSALNAIEQWGFFTMPHLLWHGPTVYNGHLRGPVTLTPVAERLALELSLPVFTTQVCCDRGSNPDLRFLKTKN